jgi:hypothetical protein
LSSRYATLSLRWLVVALPPLNAAVAIEHHWTPPPLPPPPPLLLLLPLSTATLAAAPLFIAKERGSSRTSTSVPMAAPTWKHLQVQTSKTYFNFYLEELSGYPTDQD